MRYYFAIIVVSLMFVSCTNKNEESGTNFSIAGKIEHFEKPYFLVSQEIRRDSLAIDTVRLNDHGEFAYKSVTDTLSIMTLYFGDGSSVPIFINKNWKIKVTGDAQNPDLINVTGGNPNDELTDFKEKNKKLLNDRLKFVNLISKTKDSAAVQIFKINIKNINLDLINISRTYVLENPSKVVSVVLLESFYKTLSSVDTLDRDLNNLRGEAADFYLTRHLKKYSMRIKRSQEGAYAPNFSQKDITGKAVNISDFRGKYLLLMFESTSCPLCEEARPNAIKIYNKLKKEKKNIEFVSIILNSDTSQMVKTNSVKWKVFRDEDSWSSQTVRDYNIGQIPYNILISPQGKILVRDISISNLADKLKELKKTSTKSK